MGTGSSNNKIIFRQAVKGQRPSATEHNKITGTLSKLTANPNTHPKHYAKIRVAKLAEILGRFRNDDSELDIDRSAKALGYFEDDRSSQPEDHFLETERNNYENICDPFDLVYDKDEKLLIVYAEQSGKFYPLNPRTVRHAITCRDTANNYPAQGEVPDTYPIKFVRLEFNEAGGRQSHNLSHLNNQAGEDAFVHNINNPEGSYLVLGSLIECYSVVGKDAKPQWYTMAIESVALQSESESESSISGSVGSFTHSESSQSQSIQSVSQSSISSSEDAGIIHRGKTRATILKGITPGQVDRYIDGTDTDSGIDDVVYNDFAEVAGNKLVAYAKIGNRFYLIAAECPMT